MDDHVHLVAIPHDKKGLSRAMQRIHSDYARLAPAICNEWGTYGKLAFTPFRSTTNTLGTRYSTWSETRCGPGSWPRAANGAGRVPGCIWGWRKASYSISCDGGLALTQLVGNATFPKVLGRPRSRIGFVKPHCAAALKANPPYARREKLQPEKTRQPKTRKHRVANELGGSSQR